MNPFVERHQEKIAAVLGCFDRIVITGTLPEIAHAEAMARYLGVRGMRLFDYPRWAEPLREELRTHAEGLAAEACLEIEFIRHYKAFRKEERVKAILAARGEHPGLVHIFSAMEACPSYRPWHDKLRHTTGLKSTPGKCLHYYFYFIDEIFGLCYVRVPTWAPFRLQVYLNGHHWLAQRLAKAGIAFERADNAFLSIGDPKQAQALADSLDPKGLHRRLDRWAKSFCPILGHFGAGYHWSFMQVELHPRRAKQGRSLALAFVTDVIFRRQADFQPLYQAIVRTAVQAIKADELATFLGRKLTSAFTGEAGNDFHTRIQGTRIRHHMGPASLKLYDKFALMARVECTANDVSFFKHHRWVEQRNGRKQFKLAPLRKNIYSLPDLRELMQAANERYLSFMASIDNPNAGLHAIDKMAKPVRENDRSYRGFNLFLGEDHSLFITLARGEWAISGFRASDLRTHLPDLSAGRASYWLKRLRTHGLIKKIGHRYKYYLTTFGRRVLSTALAIREYVVMPALNALLPQGHVYYYGTDEAGQQGATLDHAVWAPELGTDEVFVAGTHTLLQNSTATDTFCAAQALLPNSGKLMMTGGDAIVDGQRNWSNYDTNVYDPGTKVLVSSQPMFHKRWYPTLLALANGDMLVLGGRDAKSPPTYASIPEVYTPATGWKTLSTAKSNLAYGGTNTSCYPRAFPAPNGKVFVLAPDGGMFYLDPKGSGSIVQATSAKAPSSNGAALPSVNFAPGKILSLRKDKKVVIVDLNKTPPTFKNAAPVSSVRYWSNATVLADGKVMVSGGSGVKNKLNNVTYRAEIWDPVTGKWTFGAAAQKPRLYHSIALLLPDASVLTAGGGAPGPVKNLDGEIFYPPYLQTS